MQLTVKTVVCACVWLIHYNATGLAILQPTNNTNTEGRLNTNKSAQSAMISILLTKTLTKEQKAILQQTTISFYIYLVRHFEKEITQ